MAFAANYPVDLFRSDCWDDAWWSTRDHGWLNMDDDTNGTWKHVAKLSSCTPDLFFDGVVPDSEATKIWWYAPLQIQYPCSMVVVIYLLGGFLYTHPQP